MCRCLATSLWRRASTVRQTHLQWFIIENAWPWSRCKTSVTIYAVVMLGRSWSFHACCRDCLHDWRVITDKYLQCQRVPYSLLYSLPVLTIQSIHTCQAVRSGEQTLSRSSPMSVVSDSTVPWMTWGVLRHTRPESAYVWERSVWIMQMPRKHVWVWISERYVSWRERQQEAFFCGQGTVSFFVTVSMMASKHSERCRVL